MPENNADRKPRFYIGLIVGMPGLVVLLFLSFYFWGHYKSNKTYKIGDRICVALQAYHVDYHEYPGRLEMLVPKYLDSLSDPILGNQDWDYRVRDGKYKLIQPGSFMGITYREPDSSEWKSKFVD